MKPSIKFNKNLETSGDLVDLASFIKSSYDGIYLIFLVLAYASWDIYLIFISQSDLESWFGAVLMYPVLLFLVFIRQRLGTHSKDKTATFFSILNLTVVSVAPIYYVFWR